MEETFFITAKTFDFLSEISLSTAGLIIFGISVLYILVKGIFRSVINIACISLCAWGAFRLWQILPIYALEYLGKTSETAILIISIIAFLLCSYLLRKIVRFFLAPADSYQESAPSSLAQFILRLCFAIVPTILLCIVAAVFLHHAGSISELKESEKPTWSQKMKKSIEAIIPEKYLTLLDPMTSEPRMRLVKMIAASTQKTPKAEIDPETGKPYPRAIIVDDPELKELAKKERYGELIRHPIITNLMNDSNIREQLGLK